MRDEKLAELSPSLLLPSFVFEAFADNLDCEQALEFLSMPGRLPSTTVALQHPD